MKKFFVCFICALCMCSVFAAGENVATSKAFVDTAVAQKQDKISANSGTAQVLTNTGEQGTVGTKDIYDSSTSYANQTDALVTAGDMNAAVQNAIEAEFYCIKWVDDDPTKDCLLVQIRNVPGKNLFDSNWFLAVPGWTESNGVYTGSIWKANQFYYLYDGGFPFQNTFKPNTSYTLSYDMSAIANNTLDRGAIFFLYTNGSYDEAVPRVSAGESKHVVYTSNPNKTIKTLFISYGTGDGGIISLSNIQLEEGTTATPYEPYGVYMPSGN